MNGNTEVYSVDRSWSKPTNIGNLDGDLYPSQQTRYHLDRGDSTARCSRRVLLNSLPGDGGGERLADMLRDTPDLVCLRCVPEGARQTMTEVP